MRHTLQYSLPPLGPSMSPVSPIVHGPRRRRLEHLLCYLVLLSALRPGMLDYMSTQNFWACIWACLVTCRVKVAAACIELCTVVVVQQHHDRTGWSHAQTCCCAAALRSLVSSLSLSLLTHRDDILTHSSAIDGMTGVDTFSVANLRRPSGASWATGCRTKRSASTAVPAANGDHAEDTSFSTVEDLQGVSCCWSCLHCRLRLPPVMGL